MRADTYTEVGDLEVVNDEGKTSSTSTQAKTSAGEVDGEAELLGPVSVRVRESDDLKVVFNTWKYQRIYANAYLVLETESLCPTTHDEGVVSSNDGNKVDTLALELIEFLEVGREVVNVTCRLISIQCETRTDRDNRYIQLNSYGESSWDGEENDLLSLPLISGVLDGYKWKIESEISFDRGRSRRLAETRRLRTDTTSGEAVGLGSVRNVGEGTRGDNVADFDSRSSHCSDGLGVVGVKWTGEK